jgi:ABC-type nitrate/sulfonate/bicarbonate transport system permease component
VNRTAAVLRGIAFPLALVVAAQIGATIVDLKSDTLASPAAVAVAGARAFADGSIPLGTLQTLANAFGGLALGGAIGLAFGIVLGSYAVADRVMEFSVEALRPIPSVALIPVAMLIFGFGFRMEIAIVAFAAFWPVLILTRNAVAGLDPVEISSNPLGLGYGMILAEQSLHPDLMLAYLLWIGIVGWALNYGILQTQRRVFGRSAQAAR